MANQVIVGKWFWPTMTFKEDLKKKKRLILKDLRRGQVNHSFLLQLNAALAKFIAANGYNTYTRRLLKITLFLS